MDRNGYGWKLYGPPVRNGYGPKLSWPKWLWIEMTSGFRIVYKEVLTDFNFTYMNNKGAKESCV